MGDSNDDVYEIKGDDVKVIRAASVSSELDDKSTAAATSTADVDDYISKFLDMSEDARADDQREKSMTLKEGVKTFPKAIAWSLILSTALIMEGYDTNLLTSFYAYPGFRKKFGDYFPDINDYQVPARWQTGLSMGYQCG